MSLIFFWVANLLLIHPFHVSVCDIAYDSEDKHFKISVRLFLDDLESALQLSSKDPKLNITESDSTYVHNQISYYLEQHLEFTTEQEQVFTYLGGEIEADVMWCYLEVLPLENFEEISIMNTVFTEIFSDQENLVHVNKNDEVKSCRLNSDSPTCILRWD